MRFLLAFALCFVSVFVNAQTAPPMVLGGPQGIDVTRILARNWMSIPIYTDTPAAPLTGAGWPGRGYIIQVAKTGDTSIWQYNGKKWAKIGGYAENNYTYLESGGDYSTFPATNTILVRPSTYYILGTKYNSPLTFVIGFSKTANSNGRIDAIVLSPSGPSIIQGVESVKPSSPPIPANRLKLGFIYYPPFDTLPKVTGSELTSVFRIPGRDSIYFTSGDTTIAVKDSIGLSTADTSSMLTGYVNTASNGLTKTGKDIRLGGTLNQATRIALGGNAINIAGSADSTRFFGNGSVAVGYRPNQNPYPDDSTYRFAVNGTSRLNGVVTYKGDLLPQNTPNTYSLGMIQSNSFGALKAYKNNGATSIQQIEFGDNNTSLNTAGTLSSPSAANYGLRVYGNNTGVDSGGGSYTNFRISPTINYASNFKKAIHMGLSYEPTVQSLNNTTHIAFRNTRGSNLFNVNSGNTLIGYDTTSAAYQVDTTYKLDVNGNMRVGTIFYGANNVDTALVIRKANPAATGTGIYIGGANSFNVSPLNATYIYGDLNSITGPSQINTVIGHINSIDSSIQSIILGNYNNIPNPASHQIVLGNANTSNSYSNTQNASIVIGLGNNTNGYWGSGLIGSSLKYYDNGQLAFGGNSSNVNFSTRNVYFGNGVKVENNNIHGNFGHGPDVAINPSWANDADSSLTDIPKVSNANRNGGSLTIAGGRGTGTGTPGTVRFSTWNTTTSGSTLHPTLTERARISPTGNLLVGTTTDSIYKLDVNGTARIKGNLHLQPSSPSNAAVIVNQNGGDGSLAWIGTNTALPSNFGARNVVISPSGVYQTTGFQNVFVGRSAGSSVTSGVNNTFIGNNTGSSITTGSSNTFIGAGDSWGTVPPTTSSSIQIIAGYGHEKGADTALLGLTGNYAFIGGGSEPNFYIKDFYLGAGNRVTRPDQAHLNLYAPSGYPTKVDTIGSNFTINAGRGTGAGIGGSVIFRTSSPTTSGTTLQTLSERARISPAGNLLVGTTTDSIYKLDVNGAGRFSASGNTLSLTSPGSKIFFGNRELAIGDGATSTYEGVALGFNANATTGGVAIGKLAKAPNNSVVIGNWQSDIGNVQSSTVNILSSNLSGIGIGGATTSGVGSSTEIAIGNTATATGAGVEGNIAIGRGANANGSWAIALGAYSKADAGEFVAGSFTNKDSPKPISNVYFGSGKQPGEDTIGLSYTINGSGAKGANFNGGNITIAGGRATGNATPGAVIFSTSSDTTSGTALQTLKERARINQNGRLLIGTTSDNGFLVNAAGGTTSNGLYARGYTPLKVDYVNEGNTLFAVGTTGDTSSVVIKHGSIGEQYRVLKIIGARQGDQINVNGTSGFNTFQDTTAFFEITSTNAGFLQPRMTNVQRDSISSRPATGLQLFSTTDSANYVYRGTGGGWQKIANEISGSATLDFPSTGHGTSADLSFTVTGAELGDVVSIGIPHAAMSANISYTAWVSAANQVTIRLDHYASSGNVDPESATFKVKVFK